MFQTTNQMGISWDTGILTINNGDYICILTFYVDAYREYSRIYVYAYIYMHIYIHIYKQQYEIGDCVLDSPSQL